MGQRLFAVDGFAGFHRIDGHGPVPMLWGRHNDVIDVLVFEQFAVIGFGMVGLNGGLGLLGPRFPAVGHAHRVQVVFLFEVVDDSHVGFADDSTADEPDSESVVGSDDARIAFGRQLAHGRRCDSGGR